MGGKQLTVLTVAILCSGAMIATAIAINGRFNLTPSQDDLYRIDTWTGETSSLSKGSGLVLDSWLYPVKEQGEW